MKIHEADAQQAKSMGLKSLTQVSNLTGVSLNTLTNWHRDKPLLFDVVLLGCVELDSCLLCARGFGPSHSGSSRCESGSIASGGDNSHCSCDVCF